MQIWERYFYKEIVKIAALFLICFYGLYVIIDYTSHSSALNYHHAWFKWKELGVYYASEFIRRAGILLPFALMLATIRTLTQLNSHNELVAMLASGIQLRTLLRPFLVAGCLVTLLVYLDQQFALPYAMQEVKSLNIAHTQKRNKRLDKMVTQSLQLSDESQLIFQEYTPQEEKLFDVYWIRSIDDVYRIKTLYPMYAPAPVGYDVIHIVRQPDGALVAAETFKKKLFPEMPFSPNSFQETITPIDELSYTTLWEKFPATLDSMNEKEVYVFATLSFKLLLPWLGLLVVLVASPYCVRFGRNRPTFLIYAFGIFGFIAFYFALDAAYVLARRGVVSPLWSLWAPFLLLSGFFTWRFSRVR